MARARNIKPGFFKNEDLAELAFEYRLLFIGLWTLADRDGLMEDRPKRIKMEVFPADDVNVDKGLDTLAAAGMIRRYTANGGRYIEVCNFLKHQHPHHKEPPSTLPKPEASPRLIPPSKTDEPGVLPSSIPPEPEADPQLTLVPPQSDPSDSLIPDSGFSDTGKNTLSSKAVQTARHRAVARELIDFLNEKSGKAHTHAEANLEFIVARLKDGATPEECRMVIARKCRDWRGTDMEQYLRPATLFNRTKFASYQGDLVVAPEAA